VRSRATSRLGMWDAIISSFISHWNYHFVETLSLECNDTFSSDLFAQKRGGGGEMKLDKT